MMPVNGGYKLFRESRIDTKKHTNPTLSRVAPKSKEMNQLFAAQNNITITKPALSWLLLVALSETQTEMFQHTIAAQFPDVVR